MLFPIIQTFRLWLTNSVCHHRISCCQHGTCTKTNLQSAKILISNKNPWFSSHLTAQKLIKILFIQNISLVKISFFYSHQTQSLKKAQILLVLCNDSALTFIAKMRFRILPYQKKKIGCDNEICNKHIYSSPNGYRHSW